MVCSGPSSVAVKSFGVSPSTTLPLLSFTFTVSITNWLLVENVDGLVPPVGVFWPICWGSAARTIRKKIAARSILKPHYKPRGQTSHVVGRGRKTKLRIAERGVPTREGYVVERVCRINPQIATQPVAQSKGASSGGVQSKLRGPCNGVPPRVAILTRKWRRVSRWIERQARRRRIYGRAGVI